MVAAPLVFLGVFVVVVVVVIIYDELNKPQQPQQRSRPVPQPVSVPASETPEPGASAASASTTSSSETIRVHKERERNTRIGSLKVRTLIDMQRNTYQRSPPIVPPDTAYRFGRPSYRPHDIMNHSDIDQRSAPGSDWDPRDRSLEREDDDSQASSMLDRSSLFSRPSSASSRSSYFAEDAKAT